MDLTSKQFRGRPVVDVDHSVICVERGVQRMIALKWGLADSTVSHWLNGLYSDRSKNLELIGLVREYAKNARRGSSFFLVCNKCNNELRVFRNAPRRDYLGGFWFDPFERSHRGNDRGMLFQQELLPERLNIDFEKAPVKLTIDVIQ